MNQKTNPWPNVLASIINSITNIVLALSAVGAIALFTFYKHYYLAAGLIALAVFVYTILQFMDVVLRSHEVLTAQMLKQEGQFAQREEFYRNWINYLLDVQKGVDPVVAHNINNTPKQEAPEEPEFGVIDLPTIDGVPVKKVRT